MELFLNGASIRLTQAEFAAQGGEGAVYVRGDTAYKIYTDPSRMIPAAKIRELSVLTDPRIIRPQEVLTDADGQPVGYTMRRVQDATPLCQLFTRAFRERRGVTTDMVGRLVRRLQEGVRHVHRSGILIVDLNEMNFLLDDMLQEVLFIDVDSYQTPGFPAGALMESVRDRHASRFSEETDWFSFGIVSFQMFIGVHPYRGKHSSLPDLDSRMRANVSVLSRGVSVPASCYPFSAIPGAWLDWYRAVFEEGLRLPPPDDLRGAMTVVPAVRSIAGSKRVRLTEAQRFPAEVFALAATTRGLAALTPEGLHWFGRRYPTGPDARLTVTPRTGHLLAAWLEGGRLVVFDATDDRCLTTDLEAEALGSSDGRLYVKRGAVLSELHFLELPAGIRAAARPVANVMEHATRLFEGAAVQSVLGACYVSLLPRSGVCCTVPVRELDGYRIVDARFDPNVLMAVGLKDGAYDRFVMRFDGQFRRYDVRKVEGIAWSGLNFVALDSGVCLHLNEGDELELFSTKPGCTELKVLADPAVEGVRLFKDGAQALFAKDGVVFRAALL